MRKEISIYVHIPFCEHKCAYCAFNSFCATQQEKENYLKLLCGEIAEKSKQFSNKYVVKTIYIGGGTPSVLSCEQISEVVRAIYDNFDVYDNAEFTIEANPHSISEEKLKCWKSLRVNRVSVGVQTLSDKNLSKIGRLHTSKMAIEKIKLVRKYFANVSCDLLVGLEGEDGKTLCKHAKQLLELGIKHISCYFLEIYQNTPIFDMIQNKKYLPLGDEEQVAAFNKLANYLKDAGLERYEISNFAYPQFESKHNSNYWARGEYVGFGLSAHSFLNGKRFWNADNIDDYKNGVTTSEELSLTEEDEEKIMLGLRCNLGVDVKSLKKIDLNKNPYFQDYLKQGILTQEGGLVKLNPMFYQMSNTIISNLFEDK